MTSDILIDSYAEWLAYRKYKPGTIKNYTRPLRVAAEMGMTFSELEALDKDEAYSLVTGRKTSFKHSSRVVLQSIYSYREFLNKTQETNQ